MEIKTFIGIINTQSIKKRFIASITLGFLRTAINFVSILILAKGLMPSGYGDLMFLLGSFISIRSLFDMGSSNAYFTFISQKRHNWKVHSVYFSWITIQFIFMALFISILCPQELLDRLWVGHSRYLILIALITSFIQQQLWQVLGQVGEAERKTIRVQLLNVVLGIFNLIGILVFQHFGWFNIDRIMIFYICEYSLFIVIAIWYLRVWQVLADQEQSVILGETIQLYLKYCQPLFFLSIGLFCYDFLDKWLLQRFGGAEQQGFYQIANQFAAVSLMVTTSIINVFWKEIASANEQNDHEKIAYLYKRVTRSLVMASAALSGFLIPWTREIILALLGNAYLSAAPVLALMFLYPIHQTLGQITGVMFLACGHTGSYARLAFFNMSLSIPVSYFILAPAHGTWLPGLSLGAMGLAIKMVMLNIIGVNIGVWLIAKRRKWHFDWVHQIVAVIVACSCGYAAHYVVSRNIGLLIDGAPQRWQVVISLACSAAVFALLAGVFVLSFPRLVGMDRSEIYSFIGRKR